MLLVFFLFVFSGVLLALFCRSILLRGVFGTSYLGTSPSGLVLHWLCLGFVHRMVAGKRLPSNTDVLMWFSFLERKGLCCFQVLWDKSC